MLAFYIGLVIGTVLGFAIFALFTAGEDDDHHLRPV